MSENRSSEIWGGLAAMLVALPQAVAFGVIVYSVLGASHAAEGAAAGIIGAAAIGIFAALLGGAPRLISAPSAPAAAVMASLAAGLSRAAGAAVPAERVVLLLALAALLSGALQFLYGVIGGGRLIKYIPYPVVTGYLSGVGVLIFLSQLPKFLGLPKGAGLWASLVSPTLWSGPALLVGLLTVAVMIAAPKWIKAVPATVLAIAAGVLAYLALSLLRPELRVLAGNPLVIGPIASGAQRSFFGGLLERCTALARLGPDDLRLILMPALTLSFLLSIDTLKTCVVVDALTRSRHDSNRELRGQGIANLVSALSGGMPGSGTMGATLVNINSGGRTRLSGAMAGAFALAALLLAGPLVAWVPLSALAGILIVVAWRMFDRKSFRLLRQRSTILDFAVSATVIVAAIFTDLVTAAGVGLALAILIFIRDLMSGSVIRRKFYGNSIFSKQKRRPEEMAALARRGGQTVVCELQGSLFFGTTDQLFSELEEDLKDRKYVILDMRHVQSVDFTATHMLKQIEDYLHERQGRLLLCELPHNLPTGQDLQAYFDEVGLMRPYRNVSIFPELDDALEWVEETILAEEHFSRASGKAPLDLAEIDLFAGLKPEFIEALRGCVRERSCAEGERICAQGDPGEELYLLRRGRVRISLAIGGGKAHHISTFRRGDFFGEAAFLVRGPRSAEAIGTDEAELYVLPRDRFDELSKLHPLLAVDVFSRLSRTLAVRLRQTDSEVRTLLEA